MELLKALVRFQSLQKHSAFGNSGPSLLTTEQRYIHLPTSSQQQCKCCNQLGDGGRGIKQSTED